MEEIRFLRDKEYLQELLFRKFYEKRLGGWTADPTSGAFTNEKSNVEMLTDSGGALIVRDKYNMSQELTLYSNSKEYSYHGNFGQTWLNPTSSFLQIRRKGNVVIAYLQAYVTGSYTFAAGASLNFGSGYLPSWAVTAKAQSYIPTLAHLGNTFIKATFRTQNVSDFLVVSNVGAAIPLVNNTLMLASAMWFV